MSFNFSFSVGHLVQTHIYQQNAAGGIVQPVNPNLSKHIKVNLYPRWYKQIVVDWTVPSDWGPCIFNVYFGPTESGPFQLLNPAPISGNYLKDAATQEYSKFNKVFYVVEVILLNQNNVAIKSDPTTWDTPQNDWVHLRSQEIQRREYLLLRKFTGVKSYLFRKMTYGARCPECWNAKVEKTIKDNCNTCFGTSFEGGYFPVIPIYLQYDADPDSNIKTYFGIFEPNQIAAWTISVPEIHPDDIIIRNGEWDLFRVENIAKTVLQGKLVRQMVQLTELSKKSVEYQLLSKNVPEFPSGYL